MDNILTKEILDYIEQIRTWAGQGHDFGPNYITFLLEVIDRLTARLAAVTRERDAAVDDLEMLDDNCEACGHYYNATCIDAKEKHGQRCFKWRGVQPKGETE